jgi:hypothetical protein
VDRQIQARVRPEFLFTGEANGPELARRGRPAVDLRHRLICDTDVLSVRLWSERLFGEAPD